MYARSPFSFKCNLDSLGCLKLPKVKKKRSSNIKGKGTGLGENEHVANMNLKFYTGFNCRSTTYILKGQLKKILTL